MVMYIFYEEDDASAWLKNQFILLIKYKWIEDQVWIQHTLR